MASDNQALSQTPIVAKPPFAWVAEMRLKGKKHEDYVFKRRQDEEETALDYIRANRGQISAGDIDELGNLFLELDLIKQLRRSAKSSTNRLEWTYTYHSRMKRMENALHLTRSRIMRENAFEHHRHRPEFEASTSAYSALTEHSPTQLATNIVNLNNYIQTYPMLSPAQVIGPFQEFERLVMHEFTHDDITSSFALPIRPLDGHRDTLTSLMRWLERIDRKNSLHWLYGKTGVGKTALLRYFAYECARHDALAADFFVLSSVRASDIASGFAATIAHGIGRYIPAFKQILKDICIENGDGWIFGKSLFTQVNELIINAWERLDPSQHRPLLVVIDGIDKCGENVGIQMLDSIACCVRKLPICFLISGSREEWILNTLYGRHSLRSCVVATELIGGSDSEPATVIDDAT